MCVFCPSGPAEFVVIGMGFPLWHVSDPKNESLPQQTLQSSAANVCVDEGRVTL